MRKLIPVLILSLVFIGCSKKEESRLDKFEAEKQKKKQSESYEVGTTEPASHYQRGFDAYRDIKEIRKEEQDRQKAEQEMIDQVDNGE